MEQNSCDIKYNSSPIIKICHYIEQNKYNLYVFVGDLVTADIEEIFEQIENKRNYDNKLLIAIYGKNYNKILGIDKPYNQIKFINDTINIDDTIDIIKKKIFINLNILEFHQHLWIVANENISNFTKHNIYVILSMNFTKKVTKDDLKQYLLYHNYKEDIEFIELSEIKVIKSAKKSKQHSKTKKKKSNMKFDINTLSDESIISYNNWMKSLQIEYSLREYTLPIDKKTIDNQKKMTYEINPYRNIKIDKRWVSEQGTSILKTIPNEYIILEKFLRLKENTIYMVDILNLSNMINKTSIKDKQKLYGIYHKYFPKITKLSDINLKIDKGKQQELKEAINNNQKLINLINRNYNIGKDILTYNCNVKQIIVQIDYRHSNKKIALNRLFNIIKLSNDNPFIKWKDPLSKTIYYKVYIPSFKSNIINLNILENWIKGKLNRKTQSQIIQNKGIIFKLRIQKGSEYRYIHLNVFNDGKYEVRMEWKEVDKATMKDIINVLQIINKFVENINNIILDDDKLNKTEEDPNIKISNTKIFNLNYILQIRTDKYDKQELLDLMNRFNFYIRYIDDKNKKLNFHYRRINNYQKIDSIDLEINRFYNLNSSDNDIISQLMEVFLLDQEQAQNELLRWKSENSEFINKKINKETGIDISINYINSHFRCNINGSTQIYQIYRIIQFLVSIFYIYTNSDKLSQEDNQLIYETVEDEKYILLVDKPQEEELDLLSGEEFNLINSDDEELEFDMDMDMDMDMGIDGGIDDFDNSFTLDLEEYPQVEAQKTIGDDNSKKEKNIIDVGKKKITKKNIKNIKQEKINIRDEIKKYILNRLYRYDDIFRQPILGKEPYSRQCGAVSTRQPIVITDAEKERIDNEHPNSYEPESAIRWGSTEDNQNWYICPLYWCIRCVTSLRENELVLTVKDKQTIASCPVCDGKLIIDRKKPEENQTILIRNATYFKKDQDKKPQFDGDSDKVLYEGYPNFMYNKNLKNRSDIQPEVIKTTCRPCCFKKFKTDDYQDTMDTCKPSMIGNTIPIIQKKKKKDTGISKRFIKKTDKLCDENRYCELPQILYKFLNLDLEMILEQSNSYETRPSLLRNGILGFFRKGCQLNDNNSFLSAILSISPHNLTMDLETFKKHIVDNITYEIFIEIMEGDIITLFKNNKVYNTQLLLSRRINSIKGKSFQIILDEEKKKIFLNKIYQENNHKQNIKTILKQQTEVWNQLSNQEKELYYTSECKIKILSRINKEFKLKDQDILNHIYKFSD